MKKFNKKQAEAIVLNVSLANPELNRNEVKELAKVEIYNAFGWTAASCNFVNWMPMPTRMNTPEALTLLPA
jgi:hypothetical protein